jgi:uncharacterized protein YcnI
MKKEYWSALLGALALMCAISVAAAHVKVTPAEAKPSAIQVYTVSIPTEGKIATTRTELILPPGVALVSVDPEGNPFDVQHPADGTTVIIWRTEIAPGWAKLFHFTVTNPTSATENVWKAHQYLSDGSVVDWVDGPGAKRPASVTSLRP